MRADVDFYESQTGKRERKREDLSYDHDHDPTPLSPLFALLVDTIEYPPLKRRRRGQGGKHEHDSDGGIRSKWTSSHHVPPPPALTSLALAFLGAQPLSSSLRPPRTPYPVSFVFVPAPIPRPHPFTIQTTALRVLVARATHESRAKATAAPLARHARPRPRCTPRRADHPAPKCANMGTRTRTSHSVPDVLIGRVVCLLAPVGALALGFLGVRYTLLPLLPLPRAQPAPRTPRRLCVFALCLPLPSPSPSPSPSPANHYSLRSHAQSPILRTCNARRVWESSGGGSRDAPRARSRDLRGECGWRGAAGSGGRVVRAAGGFAFALFERGCRSWVSEREMGVGSQRWDSGIGAESGVGCTVSRCISISLCRCSRGECGWWVASSRVVRAVGLRSKLRIGAILARAQGGCREPASGSVLPYIRGFACACVLAIRNGLRPGGRGVGMMQRSNGSRRRNESIAGPQIGFVLDVVQSSSTFAITLTAFFSMLLYRYGAGYIYYYDRGTTEVRASPQDGEACGCEAREKENARARELRAGSRGGGGREDRNDRRRAVGGEAFDDGTCRTCGADLRNGGEKGNAYSTYRTLTTHCSSVAQAEHWGAVAGHGIQSEGAEDSGGARSGRDGNAPHGDGALGVLLQAEVPSI
ncbi:hypothetical protein B0H11DRAFT_1919189 [Mycena galericulata]|nr:hypothetical protein B0H11DRAFT_1919189 [Mycena galericulata]